MKSSVRPTTEQRLIEYVCLRRLVAPDAVPVVELTSMVQCAIEAQLPNTLTALLRELGRRGGLLVSVQPADRTAARCSVLSKTERGGGDPTRRRDRRADHRVRAGH